MKKASTLFLRAAVLAIGAVILALCVFALPATWRAVPGEYSGIAYAFYAILLAMYASAIPFFIGLYQALQLLKYIDKNQAFSALSLKALQRITYCAVAISVVYTVSMPFFYIWAEKDDAPGLIIVGMIFVGASLTVAVFAAVLQRLFRQGLDMKSENDLTV